MAASMPSARRSRLLGWLAYAAAWIALGLWLGVNVVIGLRNQGSAIPAWQPLTWELSSAAVIGLLAVAACRFEAVFPLSGAGWQRRLPAHLPAAVAFSATHTLGIVAIRKLVYATQGMRYDFRDPWLGFVYELQKDLITYAVIIGFCIAWRAVRARRERELAVLRLERDLSDARLAALTAQIEPHFLFNTLNAISNRMHEDIEAADRMLVAFADLLRSALGPSAGTRVRAADDVAWLERYFELMRERFRGTLETHVVLDPAARDARLPRLLLQPLIENAFEHGLGNARGRVEVSIAVAGGRLICSVADNGAGFDPDAGDGIGLRNVRSRLALLHAGDHRFVIALREGGGTRVEIDLPLLRDG